MSKETALHYGAQFIAARRGRAAIRANLAKLRRSWLVKYDEWYNRDDMSWWEDEEENHAAQIEKALLDREAANKNYRRCLHDLDKQFGKGLRWIPESGVVDLDYLKKLASRVE